MRRYLPVVALFLLSPLLAEIIFGGTTFANLQSLIFIVPIYGGGALLIREIVRRRGLGWGSVALLGAAYAIMEEGLALQSLFNPAAFNTGDYGGVAFGVNWVWCQWTIGYHIIWSITTPILLAELFFPDRRAAPWLGRIGLAIVAILYVFGFVALYLIFHYVISPDFQMPLVATLAAIVAVIALVVAALSMQPTSPAPKVADGELRPGPSAWLVGLVSLLATLLWYELLRLPDWMRSGPIVLLPMILILAVAIGVIALIRYWSAPDRRWTDLHRLALAWGPVLTNMIVGYFWISAGNRTNQLFQGIVSIVCFILLAIFTYSLYRREGVELVTVHQE